MCNEQWWRERRMRQAEESREVWLDFERTRPADVPDVDEPEVTRLEETADETVAAER